LGLGLSIVNRIVQKIGAECTVNSEVGVGSLFTVHTRYPVLHGSMWANKKMSNQAAIDRKALITASVKEDASSSFNINLGIIENDYSLKNAYAQYFTRAGYSVYLIAHVETEFTQYLEELPDLHFILSDYPIFGCFTIVIFQPSERVRYKRSKIIILLNDLFGGRIIQLRIHIVIKKG
jgi:hypothetical protein